VIEATFDPLPVDAAVAREWARLAAAVVGRGGKPRRRALDLVIAATANVQQVPLLTRNAKDFALISDLPLCRPCELESGEVLNAYAAALRFYGEALALWPEDERERRTRRRSIASSTRPSSARRSAPSTRSKKPFQNSFRGRPAPGRPCLLGGDPSPGGPSRAIGCVALVRRGGSLAVLRVVAEG
jgi:hypothetical protein